MNLTQAFVTATTRSCLSSAIPPQESQSNKLVLPVAFGVPTNSFKLRHYRAGSCTEADSSMKLLSPVYETKPPTLSRL